MKISVTLRKRKNTEKTSSLYLDISREGFKRHRKFLGLVLTGNKIQDRNTLKNAEEIRIQLLAELQRNIHALKIDSKISLGQLIEKVKASHNVKNTVKNYDTLIKHLIDFDQNSLLKKVSSISIDYLRSFKEYLISRNLNPNSINEYIIRLKAIFNYAEKNNLIQNNTAKDLEKLKKAKTEKEFLSIPELKKLESIENKSEILRAFLFACYTGLRISDIQKLMYSDIENGIVKVKMQKTSEFIYIPLTDKAKELIETKIINYSGLVFNLPTLSAINNHLKKLFLMNEIHKSKVSFHMSRHSFATIGLTIGIEIEVISKILGHKDLSTTQIYAKIVNEKINKAMDKFNQL